VRKRLGSSAFGGSGFEPRIRIRTEPAAATGSGYRYGMA
jgi:hypothetical protein